MLIRALRQQGTQEQAKDSKGTRPQFVLARHVCHIPAKRSPKVECIGRSPSFRLKVVICKVIRLELSKPITFKSALEVNMWQKKQPQHSSSNDDQMCYAPQAAHQNIAWCNQQSLNASSRRQASSSLWYKWQMHHAIIITLCRCGNGHNSMLQPGAHSRCLQE